MDLSTPLNIGHMLLIVGVGLIGSLLKNRLAGLFGGSNATATTGTSAPIVAPAASTAATATHPILTALVTQFESLVQQQAGKLVSQVFGSQTQPIATTPAPIAQTTAAASTAAGS